MPPPLAWNKLYQSPRGIGLTNQILIKTISLSKLNVNYDTETETHGTVEWKITEERTSEWIHSEENCRNESIDHGEHVEDEPIDCSDSKIYHDTNRSTINRI